MMRRSFQFLGNIKAPKPPPPPSPFNKIVVFGGGTMGGGIAQVTAQTAKVPVTIVDIDDATCKNSRTVVQKSLERVAKKKGEKDPSYSLDKQQHDINDVMSRLTFTSDSKAACADAELIVEAITEKIDAKIALWKAVDAVAPPTAILASNTSSLSITQQANSIIATNTARAGNFAGLHFFSPVPMMRLVEVIKGDDAVKGDGAVTSQAVFDKLMTFTKAIGKEPVACVDTKGFIVNRLLVPFLMEACRLVERGEASMEDVDTAMKLGAGHPMGPFVLMDSIGLDVTKFIIDKWSKEDPTNPLFQPSPLLDRLVAEGKLGRKTKEGFYKY